ncbi:MAG TPA: ABC transporter ATP-binding protein, partial [Acidimicrobiales bacterium]|nr:ABC transporter ATP-binding protein [Acidimicrobiales bacterium]
GRTAALQRPHRWTIAAAVGVDVAVTALGLAAPWPVMAVIDKATAGTVTAPFGVAGARWVVPVAVGAGVALVAMIALFEYLSAVLAETATNGVGLTLRAAAFTKLVRLPGRAAYPTGDLVTRLTGDVVRVQDAAVDRWRVVVANAFALVGMVAVLATLSPLLAAVTAAAAPLAAGLLWLRRRQVADVQRLSRRRTGELQTHLTELVRSLPAVRSFGREDHEAARLDASGREAATASVRAVAVGARLAPLADVLLALTLAVVLAVGAAQVHAHRLSVGGLVVFLTYLGALQQPVRALSTLSRTLGQGQASRERLDELLAAPELPDPPGGRTLGHRAPVIALHHVGFRYADGRVALDDVSGWVPDGRMTALLGPNGAGKSTLLHLLARLDDPAGGVVTFDGVDARAYDLRSLRSRVALVPQDGWLLDGTLADNIAYGTPGATDEAVRAAGAAALVDEFADRLPEGWATPLGEGGHALSAGQRRRWRWRWRAPCSRTARCCCSTSRPPGSTPTPSAS